MSTIVWQGGAQQVPQVNTVTPASVGVGNTFTVTINGKAVTFTATVATVANVTAGLVALLQASAEPEFQELTYVDSTTCVTITGPTDGTPFTQTSSASGGSATNVTATTTAAQSPYHWSVAANWQGGAVPVAADDVVIDNSAVPIKYGLDQHTVTLSSRSIGAAFTASIGLPERNPNGYAEYRDRFLKIGVTTDQIGQGPDNAGGSGMLRLDAYTVQTSLTVYRTAQSADPNLPALLWKGTHASNVVNVLGGTVGLACLPGEVATVTTLRVGGDVNGQVGVVGGAGLTLTTFNLDGGACRLAAAFTTLNMIAGALTLTGTGALTTANVDGGTLTYESSGTITTLKVSSGGTANFGRDPRARTVTNFTIEAGGTMADPLRTVTWTNGPVLSRCSLADVAVDFGTHLTLTIAAGP